MLFEEAQEKNAFCVSFYIKNFSKHILENIAFQCSIKFSEIRVPVPDRNRRQKILLP
jgi:hypothetical protein